MSFYNTLEQFDHFDFSSFFNSVSDDRVRDCLTKEYLNAYDFLTLLSPKAGNHLEMIAKVAQKKTIQYFGKTIQLFAPLYISNYCTNKCIYCGFNHANVIDRRKLTIEEIEKEAKAISSRGIQHILLLTGESRQATPMEYLLEAVKCLKHYFASVSIEIFPLECHEYVLLQQAGVDGLTLFQEVYDKVIYDKVHLAGKKKDYHYRLDAPERGAMAGFRNVNIGALLGLGEMRSEFFFTGLHARYLDDKYLDTEVAVSLPRFNPAECDFHPEFPVNDKTFVQFLLAFRLFFPRAGITVSTRENAYMRDHLIHLGATRFSAGVSTSVGGYAQHQDQSTPQFEITDGRSVEEVVSAISSNGYQPVYKDWDRAI
ncbi:2-iminoacetate synthase ThiH [Desulfogranum japonicum]|uniref:2-iminoacetate synthase ThiH n=1 Tax=Desulfogranum japonicum TaxID=231447 RepID=UPI000428A3E4|nr:2-iminoacetate synthase ThiH [Desulfogranum japonicum]